jgi:hypothetical protein
MNKYIIPGSVIGISLIALFVFMKPKQSSTSELSSQSLAEDLGYGSRRNSSTDSSGYYTAQDEIIGGKTKRKNKTKNKTKKK